MKTGYLVGTPSVVNNRQSLFVIIWLCKVPAHVITPPGDLLLPHYCYGSHNYGVLH